MSLLFGLSRSEWAAQSGLDEDWFGIADHAFKALSDLTGEATSIHDMMRKYLIDQGVGSDRLSLNDLVYLWDGSFGPVTNYFLLLETGDYLLLETGDKMILDQ